MRIHRLLTGAIATGGALIYAIPTSHARETPTTAVAPMAVDAGPPARPEKTPPAYVAGTAGAPDSSTAADTILKLANDSYNRMTVPVGIEGPSGVSRPFAFLIDTGAERTVIARGVATATGLVPKGRATVVGVAGTREVDLVTVGTISLGTRSHYDVESPLLDAEAMGADGIIGLDQLQGQRVLLDFDGKRLVVGDAAKLGGDRGYEIIVRARRKSGQLIMTDALIDGVRTDIVIDTGSDTTIGNLALGRALARELARDHREQTVALQSVTGQNTTADLGLARTLTMGGMTLNNTLIAFTDAPPFDRLGLHKRPALLLGMAQLRMFHRVAIDFAARRILFDLPATP